MAGPKLRILNGILEEHFEELQFLSGQRQVALRSPLYSLRALTDLDERIDAHVQGLLVGGDAIGPLVEPALAGDEPGPAFAAAYTLLRSGQGDAVLEALAQSEGARLQSITEALCHAPITPSLPLRSLLSLPNAATAIAAAKALTFHQASIAKGWSVEPFVKHEDPQVRRVAWQVVQLGASCPPEAFRPGLRDEDPAVRREALQAAVWNRHADVLGHCRELAAKPLPAHEDAIYLLAVLGGSDDFTRLTTAGQAREMGPRRFRALGAFGDPDVVADLLKGIEDSNPLSAIAASEAFTKITGADIASDKRVPLPPEDGHEPDDFEKEFLDEAFLPSADKARAHWQKVEAQFDKGTRWCRGLDLSKGGSPELWDQLDMESRWEAYLRGKFLGVWDGGPSDLERFPQRGR